MGPHLKLPIKVTKGSMPLQCNTYFQKFLPFKVSEHVMFNHPPLMKVLTDFLPIDSKKTILDLRI